MELVHILIYPALRFSDLTFRLPLHSLLLFEMVDLSTKVLPEFLALGFRRKIPSSQLSSPKVMMLRNERPLDC